MISRPLADEKPEHSKCDSDKLSRLRSIGNENQASRVGSV